MLTPFGKFCRKLRIDNGELLKDMAVKLDVTSSYLSAVENGKRKIPQDWVGKIADLYSLSSEQFTELNQSAKDSQTVIKIDVEDYSSEDKNLLLALARELKEFNSDERDKIKKILHNKKRRS